MKGKRTKTLIASISAIVMCFTMLIGTTFAWFTDSVVNTNNVIKAGNVDIELYHKSNGAGDYAEVKGDTKLFVNSEENEIIWEPGASATEEFKIVNAGTLALKYEFRIKALAKTATADGKTLADILTLSVKGEEVDNTGKVGDGYVVSGTLYSTENEEYNVSINWNSTEDDNDYNVKGGLKIYLGIELVATQLPYENDGTGSNYDGGENGAQFPNVSSDVTFDEIPEGAESFVLKTKGENSVSAEVPVELIDDLPEEVTSLSLIHSEPIEDKVNETITIESMEIVDQNGKVVDLDALNAQDEEGKAIEITVTLPAQETFEPNKEVTIYHDGAIVAIATVNEDNTITYKTSHFCEVLVKKDHYASNAVELIEKLMNTTKGDTICLTDNITIDSDKHMSEIKDFGNGYGKVGITLDGQELFGNGYMLTINGANDLWDCAINVKSGTIKNIVVAGAMRGIFTGATNGDIYMEDVSFDDVVYTYNSDGGSKLYGVYATNCTFNGWTSFSNVHKEVVFTNCTFTEGSGYAYCRPYNVTAFVGCTFEEGFEMQPLAAVSLEGCNLGGVAITADNLATLVVANLENAIVK